MQTIIATDTGPKTVSAQARAHLQIRFAMLKQKGLTGRITEAEYIDANYDAAKDNIRSGLQPNGKGNYHPARMA